MKKGNTDTVVQLEILSPGNSRREMKDKFDLYETSLISEYWIVDPDRQIIVQAYKKKPSKTYALDGLFYLITKKPFYFFFLANFLDFTSFLLLPNLDAPPCIQNSISS